MKIVKLVLALIAFSSVDSHAGTIQCNGTVEKIGMHASDKLMLKLSSMNQAVFICKPNSEWSVSGTEYTTSPETCNALLSMLMHAKATGAQMGDVWFDGDDVPATCSSWESWKSANIRHFLY